MIVQRRDRMGTGTSCRCGNSPRTAFAAVYMPSRWPADFDQEAFDLWSAIFEKPGLNPSVHVVTGGKKDNLRMMEWSMRSML